MASASSSLVASSRRRLGVRMRPDLVASRHRYLGRQYWIVKDPVALQYYRFEEEEFFLLNSLDGQASFDDIRSDFESRFKPQRLQLDELAQLVGTLHRSRLVLSDMPGQGERLYQLRGERLATERLQRWSQIMSLRFRGVDPDRWLSWLAPRVRGVFSPRGVALALGLAASALVLIAVQFDTFLARLPSFHQFFTVQNAFWLMLVLAVTKVLHEFGHGLACKHFGGECHEMGVMFLVFTPCLYCNVSDSWMLPSKWQRAAIGAAGMYVELIIASLTTWLWWCSAPGLLNHLCLSAMTVCSVTTVVFNGNPLMRYDGYYILSDLLEIPNLSGKASALLSRTAGRLFLGLDLPPVAHLPPGRNGLLLAYAVASGIYRWLVVWSIVFFLNELFKPYHLEIVGHALGMISLVGLVGVPLWRLGRFFSVPGRLDLVETVRLKWTVLAAGALLAAAWLLPLPFHVFASFEVEPHGAANLYTEVPGELVEVLVKPGDQVKQGQLLGRLRNVDVQLEFEQLRGRRDQLESQLRSLRFRRFSDDMAALQVPEVERALEAVERQLVDRQRDLTRLELRAPRDGTVLPPPEVPRPPYDEGTLPRWSGSPFEPHNRNCWMSEQDIFCTIGDPAEMHALVVVEQSEVVYLGEQMVVDLKLDARPGTTYRGGILEISSEDVKISPRHLSNKAGGELATKTDASGVERPLTTSYHVLVYPLIDERGELRIGQRGQAKIYAHWQPVGARLWRWFCRTFQFRL